MTQGNMPEAKTKLSRVARNGKTVVQIKHIFPKSASRCIGVAEGKFTVPDEFDAWDSKIEVLFSDVL